MVSEYSFVLTYLIITAGIDISLLYFIYSKRKSLERISRYFTLLVAGCLVIIVNGLLEFLLIGTTDYPLYSALFVGIILIIIFMLYMIQKLRFETVMTQ